MHHYPNPNLNPNTSVVVLNYFLTYTFYTNLVIGSVCLNVNIPK